MYLSPSNPIIKKTVSDFLSKDLFYDEHVYDYDNSIYLVSGVEGASQVRFSFNCNCPDQIWANGAAEMLEEEFKDYLLPKEEFDAGYCVTLAIDTSKFAQTKKLKREYDEETAAKIRAENEQIRAERAEQVEAIAERFAKFKRDFVGAPIRNAMKKALAGEQFAPCEVPYRKNEKYWLLQPDKNEVQVIFSVNYEDKTEQALARVMMIEYTASEKKIQRSANIAYREAAPPELVAKFPSAAQEKPSNGFLVVSKSKQSA